jgi:hypothetical protein
MIVFIGVEGWLSFDNFLTILYAALCRRHTRSVKSSLPQSPVPYGTEESTTMFLPTLNP